MKLASALERGNDTEYLNNLLASIQNDIKQLDDYNKKFSQLSLGLSYKMSGKEVDELTEKAKEAGTKIKKVPTFGVANRSSIKILANNAYNSLSNVTRSMGRQSDDFIRRIGLQSVSGSVEGSETVLQSAKTMKQELEKNGFFNIKYSNGRPVPADVYSVMVARTSTAEAHRFGTLDRMGDYGYDLVDVIGQTLDTKTSPCVPYQGKTLSVSGDNPNYTSLAEAKSQGLFHPNCVHDLGASEKNFEDSSATSQKVVKTVKIKKDKPKEVIDY